MDAAREACAPLTTDDAEAAVDAVLSRVGKDLRVATPLGLGKATLFLNALYARAVSDKTIRLKILTALTLEVPRAPNAFAARLLDPILARVFDDVPQIDYAAARRRDALPENISVEEFFLSTGAHLSDPAAQRAYNSVNYTHALRAILRERVNVAAQMVAQHSDRPGKVSLSCNPDLSLDLYDHLEAERAGPYAIVAEVNARLPYLGNDAEVDEGRLQVLFDAGDYGLFGPPAPRVSLRDYAIGLHASRLIPDNGTLQIGIGSLGDAVAHALLVRQRNNAVYRTMLASLFPEEDPCYGGRGVFEHGLYGCSEMVSQGLYELLRAGVLRKQTRDAVTMKYALEGGFYLGPRALYDSLREAPDALLDQINMTRISHVNDLYGDELRTRVERRNARFINAAMKATALGAIASDALEDGRTISGVGGQYNFVAMAHELADARSIILMRSTRNAHGRVDSNVVWSYGNTTIPRHLRDIVVTEYGVADLRGQPDEIVVDRMIRIADARFQDGIVAAAKKAGKLAPGYRVPDSARANTPEALRQRIAPHAHALPPYPFGSDLMDIEADLAEALERMKDTMASPLRAASGLSRAIRRSGAAGEFAPHLERMNLTRTSNIRDAAARLLLLDALAADRER